MAEKKAGKVFINMVDEAPFGLHPSIQIFLNQASQGRGVGRIAYRLACEASGYAEVIAHMRKSNAASRRAAEAAGFKAIDDERIPQLAMRWRRR